MGSLYIIATPIGNLEDITLRALRLLKEVSLIAAEDTRTTRKLLTHYGIRNRLVSYHQFSRPDRVRDLVQRLEDEDIALVSDAGMPCLSDPGYPLVREAIANGVAVVPIPGASSITSALAISGLPTDQFTFIGFLPRRTQERKKLFQQLADEPRTIVALESPHRVKKTLQDLTTYLPDRPLAVCRELTKQFEEVFRGTPAEALEHFATPRGEFTLVLGGCDISAQTQWAPGEADDTSAHVPSPRWERDRVREASPAEALPAPKSSRERKARKAAII